MIEAASVFCDALGLTVPVDQWESLPAELTDAFSDAGLQLDFRDDSREIWATPGDSGLVRMQRHSRAGVVAVYASGSALARMRLSRAYAKFLYAFAARPHRVTRLDATADVACDAPPVIADVLAKGRAGTVALTRKAVAPDAVEYINSLRPAPDSRVSGTVYFGRKSAEVRAAVYDKRLERYAKTSAEWDDLPERVRYELRVMNGSPTLSDAYQPAALFFQHMSPSFFPRPPGLPERVVDGLGFEIDRPPPTLPGMRMRHRAETSEDLGALCALAARDGAGGLPFLLTLVRERYQREVVRLAQSGVKGPAAPSVTHAGFFPAAWLSTPADGGPGPGGPSASR